jgi:GNAT superfamily N-acetyltransferase
MRRAKIGDAPDLSSVAHEAYEPYVDRIGRPPAPMIADYEALIREAEVWVVEDSTGVVGLLVLIARVGYLLLDNVAVRARMQGKGVGSRLLAHAEARAAAIGVDEVRLYTNVAMTENVGYYARRGYVETGRGQQDGFERVFFAKEITAHGAT